MDFINFKNYFVFISTAFICLFLQNNSLLVKMLSAKETTTASFKTYLLSFHYGHFLSSHSYHVFYSCGDAVVYVVEGLSSHGDEFFPFGHV